MRLTKSERCLIAMLETKSGREVTDIERYSDKEFDLAFRGPGFSAHLLRWAICDLCEWTSPVVANMTEYPRMCILGDWSGVRDTEDAMLWKIFQKFIVPQIKV